MKYKYKQFKSKNNTNKPYSDPIKITKLKYENLQGKQKNTAFAL